jgi:uncharacterized YigZ family protein
LEHAYKTLKANSKGLYKEKGSKFIGDATPVFSEQNIKDFVEQIRKDHPKARHFCFAYRLGLTKDNFRANDDGEPSNSAGQPILGQIDSYGLTNALIVVTRYFGGTKLGVPGLISAYKSAAADAIEQGIIIDKTVNAHYQLSFDYANMHEVMNLLSKESVEIQSKSFDEACELFCAVPLDQKETLENKWAKIDNLGVAHLRDI